MKDTNVIEKSGAVSAHVNTSAQPASTQPATRETEVVPRRYAQPESEIFEKDHEFLIELEMPGVDKAGLEVSFNQGELTIRGHQKAFETVGKLLYRESMNTDYKQVFTLGSVVDPKGITAKLENGILTLHLPKSEAARPRQIAIQD
jgi:HSP20 family protein